MMRVFARILDLRSKCQGGGAEGVMDMEQIQLTLPDGDVLTMGRGVTASEVAALIGPGLAKAALAAVVDGVIVGLMDPLERDAVDQ